MYTPLNPPISDVKKTSQVTIQEAQVVETPPESKPQPVYDKSWRELVKKYFLPLGLKNYANSREIRVDILALKDWKTGHQEPYDPELLDCENKLFEEGRRMNSDFEI